MAGRGVGIRMQMLAVALLLGACGGGGGGGAPAPAPTGATGLVPAAPALGATLADDATALRPLVASGRWRYRGVEKIVSASGVDTVYTNTVTQTAGTGGAVDESATNADNAGSDRQTVRHAAGAVRATVALDLGNGQTRTVEQIELRSPVRVGDQYTLIDERLDDGGIDVDGDGRNDALDFAAYTRVVGAERIDLVSRDGVDTVRTRTVVTARFQLSSSGALTDAQTAMLDVWFAPGVGIVRRSTDLPGSVAGSRVTTSESLVDWDGVTRGLGFLDPQPAFDPRSGARLKFALGAVGFGSHAVVMTQAGDIAVQGVALSRVDARGTVVSTAVDAGVNASLARLVGVGSGVRVLALDDAGLSLHAYDTNGVTTGAAPVRLIAAPFAVTASNELFVAAASGDTIWVAWIPYPADPVATGYRLQAQPFTADGVPLAPPTVLATVDTSLAFESLTAVGSGASAAFAWTQVENGGRTRRYVLVDGSGAQPLVARQLSTVPDGASQGALPAATASGIAMLWRGDQTALRGVTFDAAGAPRRSSAAAIDDGEALALPWQVRPQALVVGGGPKADVFTLDFQKLWPEDVVETALSIVTELTPGTGPLATDNQARLLARGVFPFASRVVGLTGSVLVVADVPDGLSITTVWRRP